MGTAGDTEPGPYRQCVDIHGAQPITDSNDEDAATTAGAVVPYGAPLTTAVPPPTVNCPVCDVQIELRYDTQQQRQITLAKHLNVVHDGAREHAEIARQIEREELFRCRFCHQLFGFKATHHEEVKCRNNPNPTPADQYGIEARTRNADLRARHRYLSGGCASYTPVITPGSGSTIAHRPSFASPTVPRTRTHSTMIQR